MSNSYTPAAILFGRRIRITYLAVLALLFVARMWSVHGVHTFLGLDAEHGEMASIAGRLAGQSTEVAHAAFVRAYAPQSATDDGIDRAIGTWTARQAKVAQLLAPVCAGEDALCRHFDALEAQMRGVAASAHAAARAPLADRNAALDRLTALGETYTSAAEAWVEELASQFRAEAKTQQHTLLLWAIYQLLATALVVAVVVEPVIRHLQRERSDGAREQDTRHEPLRRLQKMGSQLPGMVYQYRLRPDGTSHIPYSSEGIRQIYGVSPESVREDAGSVFALLHPEDVPRVREAVARSAAELSHWRDEFRVCLADGRERWVLGNAAPEREPDGSVLWHGFITDVTERRNALQAIADARTLLQSVLDAATEVAIIATDVKGRITVFNSGAERMLQYKSAEMVGCVDPMIVHLKSEVEGFETLTYAAQQDEFSVLECTYVRKDGSRLTVSLSVTAIRNAGGAINGYLCVATDVTERRQARETLQAAKEAAERANRAKSEFLATMSHEIRTPMNGVLGFANLLRDTPLDDEQREFVRTIESSGQNLLAIINDILDFSKIEAGAMTLENIPFDPSEAVEEVVALMAGRAEEKHLELGLSIAPSVPERIVADPGRLKQILVNLIGNAIKFTSLGFVHVEVTVLGEVGNYELRVSVRDTGIGIPQAAQAALFKKFTQADASTTRRYGGTGLGLAICRQLIDLMGGEIGIDSTPGAGSTFWFTTPVKVTEAMASPAAPRESAAAQASKPAAASPSRTAVGGPAAANLIRVLVAEDNSVNQMVAVRLLERLGCRVDVAGNGAEAVQMATRLPYRLIFMDCHMPEMDGFAATLEIRRRETQLGLKAMPIVALTASVLQEDRDRCVSAGMDDIICKPVQPADLAQALRRFAAKNPADVAA